VGENASILEKLNFYFGKNEQLFWKIQNTEFLESIMLNFIVLLNKFAYFICSNTAFIYNTKHLQNKKQA